MGLMLALQDSIFKGMTMHIEPSAVVEAILKTPIRNIVGVPDSTLYPFLSLLEKRDEMKALIATNECEAVGIAAGQFMATQVPSLVYLQNSGLGKTIHPIATLLHNEICALPFVLMIGWRGAPDISDEPQHKIMGKKIFELLNVLNIEHKVLEPNAENIEADFKYAYRFCLEKRQPFALVVHPRLFPKEKNKDLNAPMEGLNRTSVLKILVELLPHCSMVSTTGKISRELYEIRKEKFSGADFFTVGAMGDASSIALGIELGLNSKASQRSKPIMRLDAKPTVVLDGDGAFLMQMGSLVTIGTSEANLLHIVFDNGCHESTGGQPTAARKVNLSKIAEACGYSQVYQAEDEKNLREAISQALKTNSGPKFIHVKVHPGDIKTLGRPVETPRENTDAFMKRFV